VAAFTYPGVYIEELSSGQHTITGVATSIGAFIGWAPQGSVSEAVLVQSWSEYQTEFGGLDSRSWLGYAVNQFFANGGSQCYIVRLVWDGSIAGGVNSPVACATALAAGAGYGSATITAVSGALSAAITLGVGAPVLQSVTVLPVGISASTAGSLLQLPPLPMNATLALQAVGSNSDGSKPTLSGVNWVSSNPNILAVSASGIVTAGTTAGTATITADSGIISGSISLSVTAASIGSISVTPSSVTAVVGQTVQLAATANYSDGSAPNITAIAAFTCADAASVTFISTNALPLVAGEFLAKAADAGTTLTATFPSAWTLPAPAPATPASTLVVTAAVVTALAIAPANATVPLPADLVVPETEPAGYSASSTFSDGTTGTPTVTWTSSNPSVATIDPALGTLTVHTTGTTTITATYTPAAPAPPIAATTSLSVSPAHLTAISVTPNTLTLAAGLTQQLTVTGTFDDGSFVDMTGYATWSPNNANATVSSTGLVKGVNGSQTAIIKAQWMNINSTAAVTIKPAIPESLAVTTWPSGKTWVAPGQNLSLVATVTNSDATTTLVTSTAQWSSSTPSLISIAGPGVVAASATAGGALTLFAANPGIWANNLYLSINTPPAPNASAECP